MTNDCLFCKIITGEIPSEKIFEDDFAFAFLDIRPVNPGHTLVVPKQHSTNIYDISKVDFGKLMERVHLLASTIKRAVESDGINIGMNNENAAGQLVFHTHVHVIPRFESDGHVHWHGTPYKEGEIKKVAQRIRKALK